MQEIDERTATGEGLGGEPAAEARDAGAADPLGLGGVDFADGTVGDVLHHGLRFGAGAVVEVEEHFLLRGLGGVDDLFHFLGVHRRGFFREDMFAGFQALDGERLVKFVRHDHADGLNLRVAFEHGIDGLVGLRDAILLRRPLRGTRGRIGHRHDFRACLAETRRVILQHAACSDDSDFDGHKR